MWIKRGLFYDTISIRDTASAKGRKEKFYHMNKTHWNSIILDGTVPAQDIRRMIGESYDLTKGVHIWGN